AGVVIVADAGTGVIWSAILAMKVPSPAIMAAMITTLRTTPLSPAQTHPPDFTTSAATSRPSRRRPGRNFREKDERSVNLRWTHVPRGLTRRVGSAFAGSSGHG